MIGFGFNRVANLPFALGLLLSLIEHNFGNRVGETDTIDIALRQAQEVFAAKGHQRLVHEIFGSQIGEQHFAIRFTKNIQRWSEGTAIPDGEGLPCGAGADGDGRHRVVESKGSQIGGVVFDGAGHGAGHQGSDQILYFPLIGFGAERRGQHPAPFGSSSEHEFVPVGFDGEPGEGFLVEEQHLFVGGVLSLVGFFLRKFDGIEVQAESSQYERQNECGPVSHRSSRLWKN